MVPEEIKDLPSVVDFSRKLAPGVYDEDGYHPVTEGDSPDGHQ
jgi:hypothetical protein